MNSTQEVNSGKGKFVFIGIIIILIIVGLSVSWFLIIKPAMTQEAPVTPTTPVTTPAAPEENIIPGELKITEIKLCNNIDDNYVCDENVNGKFKKGSKIWIYAVVNGLSKLKVEGNLEISFIKNILTTGPDDNIAYNLSAQGIRKDGFVEKNAENVYLKNYFDTTANDLTGEYQLNLEIIDEVSGSQTIAIKKFTLE